MELKCCYFSRAVIYPEPFNRTAYGIEMFSIQN